MKARQFDKEIKTQVVKAEKKGTPTFAWDQDKTWEKIKSTISSSKGKAIMLYFSMAASVSILVGSNIPWSDILPVLEQPKTLQIASKAKEVELIGPAISPLGVPKIAIEHVAAPNPTEQIHEHEVMRSLANEQDQEISLDLQVTSYPAYTKETIKIRPFGGFQGGIQGMNFSVGIAAWKSLPNSTVGVDQIGVSLEFRHLLNHWQPAETFKPAANQTLFLNAMVGKEEVWTLGVGYNLLMQKNQPQDTQAVKIYYQRKINKVMQVGPEVIFSANFRQVYPGISFTFG